MKMDIRGNIDDIAPAALKNYTSDVKAGQTLGEFMDR